MKVLFISNLYPDASEPNRGLYNARLARHLSRLCSLRVLAPRPAPFPGSLSPRQPRPQDAPLAPLFVPGWYLPKIGSRWNPCLMAWSLRSALKRLRHEFDFEAVLVSWLYPDACAVARLAAQWQFPFVAVAQGTDVHQYLQHPVRRRWIVQTLSAARAGVARSAELARLLAEAGVPRCQLHVIYNGVDAQLFCPGDRQKARQHWRLPHDSAVVLYVGNLLPIKNPLLLLRAFGELKSRWTERPLKLVMAGDGPLARAIQREAFQKGLAQDVLLAGRQPEEAVAQLMQAAEVLALPSNNEGVPNVLLEAFASGLPVVATRVGGVPEIMPEAASYLGRLVPPGDIPAMADALGAILRTGPDTARLLAHARLFCWEKTAAAYFNLLQSKCVCQGREARPAQASESVG